MCATHVNKFSNNLVECIDFSDLSSATVGWFTSFSPYKRHRAIMFVCPVQEISQVMMKSAPPSFTSR